MPAAVPLIMGTIPTYIHQFPYLHIILLKLASIFLALFQLIFFWLNQSSLVAFAPNGQSLERRLAWLVVVPSLLSLLALAISAWFMLQKFFWVRLEVSCALTSLAFSSIAIFGCLFIVFHYNSISHMLAFLFGLINFSALLLVLISLHLTLQHGRNCVSNLFIKDWGLVEFSYSEVQRLDSEF